ncbi:MAG: PP2C family protein-serine/threonine phosphatase [Planctomycetota bacterium]|nr:PP2C family protein-serine/threonine phosphatase [Planctomycetota bacterium]
MTQSTQNNPEKMNCMEIWGGNQQTNKQFNTPGLNIILDSQPFQNSNTGGGDIYYFTSCASGRITRILLADVSGHGEDAADLAISLRDLMRENVNKINQSHFVKQVNREFASTANSQGFATALIVTFFRPTRTLSISNAGHPNPFFYSQARQKWATLDSHQFSCNSSTAEQLYNLPLGVLQNTGYPSTSTKTRQGDLLFLYTDAFNECIDKNGQPIGVTGLLDTLNRTKTGTPSDVLPNLKEELKRLSPSNLKQDDATAIVGEFTDTKINWKDNLAAPFRLLRKTRDRTQIT